MALAKHHTRLQSGKERVTGGWRPGSMGVNKVFVRLHAAGCLVKYAGSVIVAGRGGYKLASSSVESCCTERMKSTGGG